VLRRPRPADKGASVIPLARASPAEQSARAVAARRFAGIAARRSSSPTRRPSRFYKKGRCRRSGAARADRTPARSGAGKAARAAGKPDSDPLATRRRPLATRRGRCWPAGARVPRGTAPAVAVRPLPPGRGEVSETTQGCETTDGRGTPKARPGVSHVSSLVTSPSPARWRRVTG
jgi:hypothetical protein